MRTKRCSRSGYTLVTVVFCAALDTSGRCARADIQTPSVLESDVAAEVLERRRRAQHESAEGPGTGQPPSVHVAPPLFPKYLVWPVFGLLNAGLVAAWLLLARHYRRQEAAGVPVLSGLSRRRRRRSGRWQRPTVRTNRNQGHSAAIWTLVSLLRGSRRSSSHRHRRRHRHSHRHRRHHHSHAAHRAAPRSPDGSLASTRWPVSKP